MAVPVYASSGPLRATRDNLTVVFPDTVNNGDFLIVTVVTVVTGTMGTPTGFTLEIDAFLNGARVVIFSKVADGTETGSLSITFGGSPVKMARMHRYTGADSVEVIGSTAGSSKDPAQHDLTTTADDRLVLQVTCINDDETAASFTGETGGNLVLDFNDESTLNTDAGMSLQSADMASAGTLSGGTWSYGGATEDWITAGFAIFQAASGSTTDQAVAVTHTIAITDVSAAAIRIFTGAISHAAAITLVKGVGLPRAVTHTATITPAKKVSVFKSIAHAIAASTVLIAIRNFTSVIAHAVGVTTVRVNAFAIVSNIAHSLAASTTLSTIRILISNIAHGLAAFTIKKISVFKAVTHTIGGGSTRLVKLIAKAVAHIITITPARINIRLFVSNVAHSTSVTSAKFIRLIKAVTHSVAVALVKTIGLPRAVAHVIAASSAISTIRNFTSAITHTITITTVRANFFTFVSDIAHSITVSTLTPTLRFFAAAVSHAIAATLVKRIRFTKTVGHATAATSVKLVKLITKAISHAIAVTTVRVNAFAIVSTITHAIAASTTTIIIHALASAISHATAVALVKKIGLVRAVTHTTAVASVKLVKLLTKSVTHTISVAMTTANKFLISSPVTHTATMSLVKTIKMAKAIGHVAATASAKVVKISRSVSHSVAIGAEQVATLLSVSSVTHTIGAVTGSVLRAAHSVAVGISHVASLATLFIDGGGGGPVLDKLHRRLRAWRKMFN